ncbi:hypothetical protein SAMN04244573_01034 [Azotobacter beijerinckii]|uniref:Uncharacterized protein n=1 Tax=Azotobacter beijerinckii TaxID=170623 RepID=A0A1H9DB47_9GAMM|nr:hypothetical protein [Azotobacter beijerinckii]SEQ10706.1 hypothetical protein SAMN04244573_01034 [Azotobacter beijerinckii]
MSQRINLLLLLIVDTITQVSAKGRWTPYFDIGGRYANVSLYFRPQAFDRSAPPGNWPSSKTCYAHIVPATPADEEKYIEELQAMLAFARRHLEDRQEAA